MIESNGVVTTPGGEIFHLVETHTRSNLVHYRDLSDHVFTPQEKNYFCAMVRGDIDPEEAEEVPLSTLAKRYNLN